MGSGCKEAAVWPARGGDGKLSAFPVLETCTSGVAFRERPARLRLELCPGFLRAQMREGPSLLPAAFREARGARALRRGEPGLSAMGSAVRVRRALAPPPRLRPPSRTRGGPSRGGARPERGLRHSSGGRGR